MKCLRAGDQRAHHLEGAEGIRPFLQAAFCVDGRRVMPYYKYLKWELLHFPLPDLSFRPEELLSRLDSVLQAGDCHSQQDLLRESERLARANGYGHVFDAWAGKDRWAISFVPRPE